LVVVVRVTPTEGLRAVTVAPVTTAPAGSRTKPLRLAEVASACACAEPAPKASAKAHASTKR
jgi:hypothetical protein